jgi:hypothetical protein
MMDYVFDTTNKYYGAIAKPNPKDKIEVEIGDSKDSTTFYPQFKIKRWDNEVNASFRLIHDNIPGNITYTKEEDRIIWSKKQGKDVWKAVFYDKPDASEEGGYEFEIYLPKKPPINSLSFSINTKELRYSYQPALDQEPLEEGQTATATQVFDSEGNVISERPENVVGSYAVYYKNCPANYADGKEYKVGKAFHIYRPHAVDSVGNSTWGDVSIDEVAGTMTISVPWDFLNSAIYPVIVDPTFGYTTAGGSIYNQYSDYWNGSVFTSPSDAGDVSQLTFYAGAGSAFNEKAVIVLKSSMNIVSNGVGDAVAGNVGGYAWTNLTYTTQPTLSASTAYVLGGVASWQNSWKYDTGDANQGQHDTSNSYTSPTNPTDATQDTKKFTIYATYTASGGAGTNMKINISDTWKDVSELKINIGDNWKSVTKISQNIGDSWKTVFGT